MNASVGGGGGGGASGGQTAPGGLAGDKEDPIRAIMDHTMEMASNEKMRGENLYMWTLRFKDPDMETKVPFSCLEWFCLRVVNWSFLRSVNHVDVSVLRAPRGHVQVQYGLLLHRVVFHCYVPNVDFAIVSTSVPAIFSFYRPYIIYSHFVKIKSCDPLVSTATGTKRVKTCY